MRGALLDTHVLVWHLAASPELSPRAVAVMDKSVQAGKPLFVSVVSVLELIYLVEKGRLPKETLERCVSTLSDVDSDIFPVAFDMAMALAARQIPRSEVPDMPDRIIAATALHLGVPLITRDGNIRKSGVETIW